MIFIFLGKPLVFWFGALALIFFISQIATGVSMTYGKKYSLLKYHKLSAAILVALVAIHVVLGLLLYF